MALIPESAPLLEDRLGSEVRVTKPVRWITNFGSSTSRLFVNLPLHMVAQEQGTNHERHD